MNRGHNLPMSLSRNFMACVVKADIEKNRERAARRAKKRIRHSCKSAKFDRMLTLTTRDSIFDRDEFQRMIEKFIRLVRKASGDAMPYVLTVEKHDSIKTSEAKRGSLHAHVAIKGRQDYKLLQSIGIIVFVVVGVSYLVA